MALADYDITHVIASSPRSVVRRARRRSDGRAVVLKGPAGEHPGAQEVGPFEFEYRVLRELDAPGVIRALDFERSGSEVALVLEDFGGSPLPVGRPIDLGQFFAIAIQVATALGHIHARGVIHKDVKPKNLLRSTDGQVKLIDFHIASRLSRERQSAQPGEVLGSLPYLSPEQTGRMNRELDYRSDYYSLGITFFELLTGRLPFEASDPMGWVHCHISKRAPRADRSNPLVPGAVSEVVGKLMAKDPEARYQGSFGLLSDLRRCQAAWEASGTVPDFAPGADDVPERFQVAQGLYGRETELHTLLEAFEEAGQGAARLLLVSGTSGVGKTALIQEVHKPVVARKGYFVSGKWDRLERDVPYGAIVQALRQLVRALLSETDDRLEEWRRTLRDVLGANAQVMIDLVPELASVLGPQPPTAGPAAADAQSLFHRVFQDFLGAFARPEHPLVVFLDDLQWMDASTPTLLSALFAGGEARHTLVIGAYRDNETGGDHLLRHCVARIRSERPQVVEEIHLRPLDEDTVNRQVADSLRSDPDATRPLTSAIFAKTEGNPFFTSELLSLLHEDGAFTFDAQRGRWDWNLDVVRRAAVSDDVAGLMVQRMRGLRPESMASLRLAACIGARFDLATLAGVAGASWAEVARSLWEPIVQRVVVPLDADYRLEFGDQPEPASDHLGPRYQFQHDRVQQAAYSFVEPAARAEVHLRVGRLLRARRDARTGRDAAAGSDDAIFEVVNHLNLGEALVRDAGERAELARLNVTAGQRAKRSSAYAIAARYLENALSCVAAAADPDAALGQRAFAVRREQIECLHLVGESERAQALCDELLAGSVGPLDAASLHSLKTRILEHRSKLLEAVGVARAGLALLGFRLPEDHAEIDAQIGQGLGRMQAHLAKTPVESLLELPDMTDAEKVMAMNLLFQVIPSAIQTYPPLFVLAELMMFDLALTHGTTDVSCKNFVDCGIIQGGILGDYDTAYRLGRVAFRRLERYPGSPLRSAVHFVFAAFVSHWRAPHSESFASFAEAKRLGLQAGDLEHVAYAMVHEMHRALYVGRNLAECEAENAESVLYLRRARAAGHLAGTLVSTHAIARLTAGPEGDGAAAQRAEQEALAAVEASGNAQWNYSFGASQALVSVILGEWEGARRWLAMAARFMAAGASLATLPDVHLCTALVRLRDWGAASESERPPILDEVKTYLEKLRVWSQHCPENVAHKHALLAAEVARAEGEPLDRVVKLYEEAISATGSRFVHLSALAHELESAFWQERGQRKIARMLVREAYQLYSQWGATAKLRALEAAHPGVLARPGASDTRTTDHAQSTTATGGLSLEMSSVFKATRAIAGEVRAERLFAVLMETLLENAGAGRGALVLRHDETQRLTVEASASVEAGLEILRSVPLEAARDICPEIVRYAVRARETLVLDDAARQGSFQSDPYISRHAIKSVLCLPLLNRGQVMGVFYAENNATPCAFTKEHLQVLSVMASQAAISIANALLYDNLEQKVEERTVALARKSREMGAMLDGMAQGVLMIDSDLVIQPQYSRYTEQLLGTRDIAGRPCLGLVFRGAKVRPDAISAMDAALRFSFDAPVFLAEANVDHLIKEFERVEPDGRVRSFEVDWNLIADEQDKVASVLVAIRDVTIFRELQETASRKSREMDVTVRILDAGLEDLHAFSETARRYLEASRAVLESSAPIDADRIRELFRNMHTVKGNARLLGFTHVVDAAHEAETAYDALRRASDPGAIDRGALLGDLRAVEGVVAEYDDIGRRKLGAREHARGQGRIEAGLRSIEKLLGAGAGDPGAALTSIARIVHGLRAVPLSEVVKETSRILPSLARELDRSVPEIVCEVDGLMITAQWADALRDALVQVFRNAMAHGIEGGDEREAAGKPRRGTISLRATRRAESLELRISDDGRGLALDSLRRQMPSPDASDEAVAERIFASALSTACAVSQMAGRGVGMDIVRSAVRARGGDVALAFRGAQSGGHRPFDLVVTMPHPGVVDLAPAR